MDADMKIITVQKQNNKQMIFILYNSQWLDRYNRYHIVNQYNTGPRLIVISQSIGEERIILNFFSSGWGSSNVFA